MIRRRGSTADCCCSAETGDFICNVKINYNLSHERIHAALPHPLLLDQEQVILETSIEGGHGTSHRVGTHRRKSLLLGGHGLVLVNKGGALHLGDGVHVAKERLVLPESQVLLADLGEIGGVVVPICHQLSRLGNAQACGSRDGSLLGKGSPCQLRPHPRPLLHLGHHIVYLLVSRELGLNPGLSSAEICADRVYLCGVSWKHQGYNLII